MTQSAPSSVRVLTWNVHGCVGRGGRFDPGAVIAYLQAIDPDIAALQEVDARRERAGATDTFALIADATGRASLSARTLATASGDYGHMLLSRWPLGHDRQIDLSVPAREPRAAIVTTVSMPGLDLRVLATHLGLRARERSQQINRIRVEVEGWGDAPGLVMGDFNEWRRRSLASRRLCPPFRSAASVPSFPARYPRLALDKIWCRAPLIPQTAKALHEASDLSDHLPVLAELAVTRDASVEPTPRHSM